MVPILKETKEKKNLQDYLIYEDYVYDYHNIDEKLFYVRPINSGYPVYPTSQSSVLNYFVEFHNCKLLKIQYTNIQSKHDKYQLRTSKCFVEMVLNSFLQKTHLKMILNMTQNYLKKVKN